MAENAHPQELIVQMQDGTHVLLRKNEQDLFVVSGLEPAAKSKLDLSAVQAGQKLVGFGPWPTWSANTRNRVATCLDEESGVLEPERLFVFREQYLFVPNAADAARPIGLGPIDRAWFPGTEGIVQAHHAPARH